MFLSDNGRMIELPEDIRPLDQCQIYGGTLVIHYVTKGSYGVYYQTEKGLEQKANVKLQPRFYKPNFMVWTVSRNENVLYNLENGIIIAKGNFKVPENVGFNMCAGRNFKAFILKFYEDDIENYRIFDDKGNEVLDSEYVGNGKKVELMGTEAIGNIMPLRIREDKYYSDRKGVLHVVFNDNGISEVIQVIPATYDEVHLNLYAGVKDSAGKLHYPTYEATKNGKEILFTFAGTRIRLPK